MTTHKIAIAARKGGVGKTTTSVHLAHAFAELDKRVLLIDMDGQCNATRWLKAQGTVTSYHLIKGESSWRDAVTETVIEGVSMIAGHPHLDMVERETAGEVGIELELRDQLDGVDAHFDIVLFDCPAFIGLPTAAALTASDFFFVPTMPSTLALQGLPQFVQEARNKVKRVNRDLDLLGILQCRVKASTLIADDVMAFLREEYGTKLLETRIRDAIRYAEVAGYNETMLTAQPERGDDYRKAAREIIKMLEE